MPEVHFTGSDGKDHFVTVEVVRKEEELRRGLMYRRHLDPDVRVDATSARRHQRGTVVRRQARRVRQQMPERRALGPRYTASDSECGGAIDVSRGTD